jgi:thiamine-phosphate pyrophosphorylase
VGVLQVREKAADDRAFLAAAEAARRLCDRYPALLIVNDHVALAAECGADGAHVGEHDLPPGLARALLGPERLLGLSTHDAEEVLEARTHGVDYVGLGPCFPTGSKALARAPGGPELVRGATAVAGGLPLFPIGGITSGNAGALAAAGARRLAVGSAVLRAADPGAEVRALAALLPPL